jgi:hypothetical protein
VIGASIRATGRSTTIIGGQVRESGFTGALSFRSGGARSGSRSAAMAKMLNAA